jgi:cell wall-associated NlpC family hydrolase
MNRNKKIILHMMLSASIALGSFTALQAPLASAATAEVERTVSMRTGASTEASRIRYAQEGEKLDILATPNSYWYKVKDRAGRIGYVSSSNKYIDVVGGSTSVSSSASSYRSSSSASGAPQKVINAGNRYLGTPYEFGSNRSSTKTFDCSDFVRQAFKEGAGITLPSNSRAQADYVREQGSTTTNWSQLKPGALMFFMGYKGSKASDYSGLTKSKQRITHVGLYLGNGKILHTYSKDSGGVRVDTIDNRHWEYRFIFGGSIL